MIVGYCRTSKTSQELAMQKDALEKYGVDHIYTEQMSGVKQRPVLESVLAELNEGDTLVVWKLDRLGRTSKELVNMIDDFDKRGIHFVSITEQFDTTTPTGKFVVTMFIAMAQLERDVIERQDWRQQESVAESAADQRFRRTKLNMPYFCTIRETGE